METVGPHKGSIRHRCARCVPNGFDIRDLYRLGGRLIGRGCGGVYGRSFPGLCRLDGVR
jgi:hypothetical protein